MIVSRLSLATTAALLFLGGSLIGCNAGLNAVPAASAVSVTGNWQLTSTEANAARLPGLSGELKGSGSAITGLFHSNAATACVAPATVIELTGAADARQNVTLTGANVAGGTLTVKGTLAADGKSLSNASYMVTGGTCAFAKAVTANAQVYSSISGNYTGSFSDPDGHLLDVTATLSQTPDSDTSGDFHLSGTGSFGQNPCFSSPVSVSDSQVTGGSFTLTYADQTTGNSVTANGTFSPDGTTLTVTGWTLTGSCGPDTGTGILNRH